MKKPSGSTISILVLLAVVAGAVVWLFGSVISANTSGPATLGSDQGPGTVVSPAMPIQDFTLTDQTGKPFTFSSTKGKPVLMAFIYTHCSDVCPFISIKMLQTLNVLGTLADKVELVAIDTDPERDTVPVLAAYSRDLHLYDKWHVLTGTPSKMAEIYKKLKITVIKAQEEDIEATTKAASDLGIDLPKKDLAESPTAGLSQKQIALGGEIVKKYSGGYEVAHSAPFWVIGTDGKLHTTLDVGASPTDLAGAVKNQLAN